MPISRGEIFQPKSMVVNDPGEKTSVWEQVLPSLLTSIVSNAAKSYISNQLEMSQLDKQRVAEGWTKNPDGTWNQPKTTVNEIYPGLLGVSQGTKTQVVTAPKAEKTTWEQMKADLATYASNPNADPEILNKKLSGLELVHKATTGSEAGLKLEPGRDSNGNPIYKVWDSKNNLFIEAGAGLPAVGTSTTRTGAGGASASTSGTFDSRKSWGKTVSPKDTSTPFVSGPTPAIQPQQEVSPTADIVNQAQQTPSGADQVVGQLTQPATAGTGFFPKGTDRKQTPVERAAELEGIKAGGYPLTKEQQAELDGIYSATENMSESRTTGQFGNVKFKEFPAENKEYAFQEYIVNGKEPRFARNDRENYGDWEKEKLAYMKANNITANDVAAIRAEMKAHGGSMLLQSKNLGMMLSFVNNMEQQVSGLNKLLDSEDFVSRFGARAVDKPLRELKKTMTGAVEERIIDGYVTELQRELNRLSGGMPSSIAEMSESSRQTWEKILDPNVPLKDLKRLGEQTLEWAQMRKNSLEGAMKATSEAMRQGQTVPSMSGTQPPSITPSPATKPATTPKVVAPPSTKAMDANTFWSAHQTRFPSKSEEERWLDWAAYKQQFGIK